MLACDNRIVDKISPKLTVAYNRSTFANPSNMERLTIDTDLTYIDMDSSSYQISNMVIAELKRENSSPNTPLYQHLKGLGILPAKFSKYCMGIAMTEACVKSNRFKKKILGLRKFS
jgi:hypothetical protein